MNRGSHDKARWNKKINSARKKEMRKTNRSGFRKYRLNFFVRRAVIIFFYVTFRSKNK